MKNKTSWGWLRIFISLAGKTLSFLIPLAISFITIAMIVQILKPYFWLVIGVSLIFLISTAFIMNKIQQIHNERETIYDNIVEVLKSDMLEQSKDIKNRPGKIAPDKPYVNLENYNSAISSIKAKGFVELKCQNMGLEIDNKRPLHLNFVTPGMFQFFMILTFGNWDGKSGYLRIYEPEHLDPRDYTETWFFYIFPILGNMSQSISDKLVGNPTGELSGDFYMITNYRLIPIKDTKQSGFFKLRVYI